MANIKWSAFPSTTATSSGDSVVGLHSGVNERFLVSATATASGITLWDANSNLSANNFISAYATTATAGATTTLLVGSKYQQYFTGVTTQIVLMPVTSTLVLGQSYYIVNKSTGVVTVKSSGANTIQAMEANSSLLITCILTSGTTGASWNAQYTVDADISGAVLLAPSTDQTITGAHNLIMATGSMVAPTMLPGNLSLTDNTLASVNTNGNINFQANGTGQYLFGLSGGVVPEVESNTVGCVGFPGTQFGSFRAYSFLNSAVSAKFSMCKSRSTTVGSFVVVQAGDPLGAIYWKGDTGAAFSIRSVITSQVTTVGSFIGSNMIFQTSGTGSASNVTALTIDDSQIVTLAHPLPAGSGGTGVNNGSNTLTLAGTLATSGAFASTFTMTGATNVTFPTSGTLATTAQLAGAVLLAPSGIQSITSFDLNINTVRAGLGNNNIASNTCFGMGALNAITTASAIVGVGNNAMANVTTGSANVGLGYGTGSAGASGSAATVGGAFNTFLGYQASGSTAGIAGGIAIGANAVAAASTGGTSGDDGVGISVGSAGLPVGFRGDGTIYPTAGVGLGTLPLTFTGYWRVKINGTFYKIPLYPDA